MIHTSSHRTLVDSREKWREVVRSHGHSISRLLGCKKSMFDKMNAVPQFGEGMCYMSITTLGEWAKRNGMNLTI